jgi:hypothetical protein
VSSTTPCVSPQLARSLAARLRDATAAGEQLASFAFGEDAPTPGPELVDGDELDVAHDFLLRTLGEISDPVNWEILAATVPGGGIGLDDLAAQLQRPRLAVTERVNALIQLGLMSRDLEHDRVCASPAGDGLFELIRELDAEIARWLSKRRRAG